MTLSAPIAIVNLKSVGVGNETVLLVEDEAMILDMVSMMLENLGYRLLAANASLPIVK